MVGQFFIVLKDYFIEILPSLALGFFLSGLIHEFIPMGLVERYLGGRGIKPLLYSTLVGTALPICCMGALPVAVSLHRKGARLGPVMAFLVATPATSVPALLVCYVLLGIKFTVFIFFAVVLMGLVMGAVGNLIKFTPKGLSVPLNHQEAALATDPVCGMSVDIENAVKAEYDGRTYYFCCPHCKAAFGEDTEKYISGYRKTIVERIIAVFKFGFVDMVREIGPELLLGLALAALVVVVIPVRNFVGAHLGGCFGYLFSLVFGLIMYICSTASVPLVDALISQGMAAGAGMVLLLVGPITSWGTIMVLRKEFGGRILLVYLGAVSMMSLALGFCFSMI